MSTSINIQDVRKQYGDNVVIPNLSLVIKKKEFFTLLGPSGCGKTTLLRMIAGFNSIEKGEILFEDTVINNVPPYKRDIGMVFQNYAIFPHMTVQENVEYGLRQKKVPAEERNRRTNIIMKTVKISDYADRYPDRLSGGQQQRVALARAIVINPKVLLMDEPLSNLDAKLRVEMRGVIRDIQKQVGITTVYVTHDQEEALAVSDRIAVMNKGEIQQIGTPIELYHRPHNIFVATFIGTSMIFDAQYDKRSEIITIGDKYKVHIKQKIDSNEDKLNIKVCVRPEEFILEDDIGQKNVLHGTIRSKTFLGKLFQYEVYLDNMEVIEVTTPTEGIKTYFDEGDKVAISLDPNRLNVFNAKGDSNLLLDNWREGVM